MSGAELNKERSLRVFLLGIIQDTHCSFETVALAAELIAADARFNDWFLNYAKKHLCEDKILELLEHDDCREINDAWGVYVSRNYIDEGSLQDTLSNSARRLTALWNSPATS